MKKIIFLTAMMISFMSAFALRIEYGKNIIISLPVYEDLYIAGGTVTINAPVYGDLIVAGGTVIINDSVMSDIHLIGGTVTFNGFAGDDIRCAGSNIRISKNVKGDVVVTAGDVVIERGVTIGGLLAGGGDMTIDGNVNGNIKGALGKLHLNGDVAGDIDCRGGQITLNGNIKGRSTLAAEIIVIGDGAVFHNDVRYWNRAGTPDFKQSVKNGKAVYDPSLRIRTAKWYYLGAITALGLLWYLGMAFLIILIVQYLFSATMKKAADSVFYNTLKSFGWGILFFIAVPVAVLVALITIVGVPVGLLLLFAYIVLILLATIISSVVASNWINNRFNKNWTFWRLSLTGLGMFILIKLVTVIPFAGWLFMALATITSFGGVLLSIRWKKKGGQRQI